MKEVVSTMAGTVFQVLVSKGETVQEGDIVIVLESMKMEIPIESTFSGVIKEINVNVGDFVNEGEVLVTIE